MIIVNPIGGLANRMRVMVASLQFAARMEVPVEFIWENNTELGANFYDLFSENEAFIFREPFKNKLISSYKDSCLGRIGAHIWNKFSGYGLDYYFSPSNVDAIVGKDISGYYKFFEYLSPFVKKGANIFYRTCNYLEELENVCRYFSPSSNLLQFINSYQNRFFSGDVYGCHIRRTDHTLAINNSPTELFCQNIEQILMENPSALFYLSTDDKETLYQLKQRYGENVLIREKCWGRDSADAMKDAVIDMWLLSRTKMIFGSHFSSFGSMAAKIGNIPLKTIHQ